MKFVNGDMRVLAMAGVLMVLFTMGCITNGVQFEPTPVNDYKVHALYVVPADQDFIDDNAGRVIRSMIETERWYQTATGGLTFEFLDPVNYIEVYITDHPLAYYESDWWGLLLTELRSKGFPVQSSGTILMVWVEGLNAVSDEVYSLGGWGCDGACGAAILPITSVQAPTLTPVDLGTVFHELGHALQLIHPVEASDLPLSPEDEPLRYSVMCQEPIRAGTSNTDHGFLTSEKAILRKSRFMKKDVFIIQNLWTTRIINYPVTGTVPDPVIQYVREGSTRVKFSSNIDDGLYYYWNFGDGIVSNEKEPVYDYGVRATYNVTLMVTTTDFMAARTSQFINLN